MGTAILIDDNATANFDRKALRIARQIFTTALTGLTLSRILSQVVKYPDHTSFDHKVQGSRKAHAKSQNPFSCPTGHHANGH